jgi:GT2 family glycosyltransferase
MGLVAMDGGSLVNTSGGVLHFTGVGWAGQAGEPVSAAGASPAEVAFASGACLVIPRSLYLELGGFPEHFFMYCEDVDLSLRVRLRGQGVGVVPGARVDHDYDFHKGALKWRLLERNRVATIVRTYPGVLLALVAPALLVTELAIFAAAIAGGWGLQKLLAWRDVLFALPRLLRERAAIQRSRVVGAAEFARWLTPELSSPYLGGVARSGFVQASLRAYWRVVTALLR